MCRIRILLNNLTQCNYEMEEMWYMVPNFVCDSICVQCHWVDALYHLLPAIPTLRVHVPWTSKNIFFSSCFTNMAPPESDWMENISKHQLSDISCLSIGYIPEVCLWLFFDLNHFTGVMTVGFWLLQSCWKENLPTATFLLSAKEQYPTARLHLYRFTSWTTFFAQIAFWIQTKKKSFNSDLCSPFFHILAKSPTWLGANCTWNFSFTYLTRAPDLQLIQS